MKKNIQVSILTLILCISSVFIFSGCKKEGGQTDGINGIFIVPTTHTSTEQKTISLSASPSIINFATALYQPATGNVRATLAIDNSLISVYNTANGTAYTPMPASSVQIGVEDVSIATGKKVSVQDSLLINSSRLDPDSTYLIPLKVASVSSGINLNSVIAVKYYIVNLKRPDWIVSGFSSQEANGEGPNNGKVIFAFDGNPNSFWHSQWQGALPGPPHWFTIDMQISRTINGFKFLGRQPTGANKLKDIVISVSADNVTWTTAGSFTLQKVDTWQEVILATPVRVRYFTVTINSTYDANTYTNLAELQVF